MPTPKWAKKVDEKLEAVADEALDRAKAASHTWVAIAGLAGAIVLIFGLLIAL